MIGDHDPEDAYDAADEPGALLTILERVIDELWGPDDGRNDARRDDALRLVGNLERRRGVNRPRLAAIRDALEDVVMGRLLTDLADVCRTAGWPVIEVDGWPSRGRGGTGGHDTGGYTAGQPSHVIVHHTASPASSDGWPDVNYCTHGDDDAPLCNLYLARTGDIYVCAAMATNCNGSGIDPCGHVADDSMNGAAIAIEAGNAGTGERWPPAQLDAYTALCRALCDGYAIPTGRIHAHAEYAPSRKVDPLGPDRYAPGAQTWDMGAFRADCAEPPPAPGPTPPPTEPEDDDMRHVTADGRAPMLTGPGFRHYARSQDEINVMEIMHGPPQVLPPNVYDLYAHICTDNDPWGGDDP